MAEAGECMGTECGPAGEGTKNPGEETPCWAAEEGELDPRKPELGEGWGSMAGEGFMPGRGGGEAREKPVATGLATNPPPCPLVWSGAEIMHSEYRMYMKTSELCDDYCELKTIKHEEIHLLYKVYCQC